MRKLGQNFILDPSLLDFIVRCARPMKEDTVLEVGVGTGQLTSRLAERAGRVVGVEVDSHLHAVASEALKGKSNVTLLRVDVLASKNRLNPEVVEAVRSATSGEAGRLLHVSNLAYRIATPLIINLLESDLPFEAMVTTVQMELAEKITAKRPGDRGYGPVSLLVGSRGRARIVRPIPRDVFWPKPRIRSAVVGIDVDRDNLPDPETYGRFRALVKGVFTLRRKTLHRALESLGFVEKGKGREILAEAGIAPEERVERLDREHIEALAEVVARHSDAG
jgi:16S rRNA (adenine1518-N6/adenine1519-N6)-dimethyltransferase